MITLKTTKESKMEKNIESNQASNDMSFHSKNEIVELENQSSSESDLTKMSIIESNKNDLDSPNSYSTLTSDAIIKKEKCFTNNHTHELTGTKRKFESNSDFPSDIKISAMSDEKKIANLRKNIRDVMGENQLDTNTIAAQREESERLARVAEQQKIIRQYQRQTAVNKHNVRQQNKVLTLLQSCNTFAKETDLSVDSPLEMISSSSSESNISEISVTKNISPPLEKKEDIESIDANTTSIINIQPRINDIVTIEDSSSEDDCIILSDEEEDQEDEAEDDPSNSGLHVKDTYNVPDEKGRVVVNIGHPSSEDDIFVAPQIAQVIKPHQIGGVRFLFDNVIESTKRFNCSPGFGCILAHSMGLGKTLQVVCFCDIFLRYTDSKNILCVMPINTLQNWVSEFNMWIPKESCTPEQVRPRTFNIFVLNDQQKTLSARGKVILKWADEGGVLLMGYELFRLLALKLVPSRKRRVVKNATTDKVETGSHKRLSECIYKALVKPGPDLVICDEGHRIKNSAAGISLALKQIRTRRRIVLTGYPLQNNLMEYWCMVDFVRPNYLGTRTEFSNMFERPIQNGQCIDSTPEDKKLMRYRAHVLHSLLVGFVQRRSHAVLQHSLPQKLEYVILTKMSEFQRNLYETFMNEVVRKKTVPNPLKAFAVCCKIWNHPDVLYNFLKIRETDLEIELDDGDTSADIQTSLKNTLDKTKKNFQETEELSLDSKIQNDLKSGNMKSDLKNTDSRSQNYVSINKPDTIEQHTKGFNNEYSNLDFYQFNQSGSFITESSGADYWRDTNSPYYAFQSLGDNISQQKPDYVGTVVNQATELEIANSSSQIVDLDTKEIQIVETDIDKTINEMVKKSAIKNKTTTPSNIIPHTSTSSNNSFLLTGCNEKEGLRGKGDDGIPYDWAVDIIKGYEPNLIQNSPKMRIFFCILNESIKQGDRVLLFSQSLLTLNLIEKFLQSTQIPLSNNYWTKNGSYFRLDGSTTSQEREKLVNDFNANQNLKLFLISTKAGSLGINLVGANRVVVFDASWNPCHDTQAVYRIYRYGQRKPCFVYRIVMDKCLEKKIYDRQVKKQGISNRVVDECNPDAHLSMKDVTNLCYDYDTDLKQTQCEFEKPIDSYSDTIIQTMVLEYKDALSKEPFYHESLLVDRKEKKLSQAEKRQAQRGYELEKKASSKHVYSCHPNRLQYKIVRSDGTVVTRPVASVQPMQAMKNQTIKCSNVKSARWIPAEVWQRQGMTAQEMTLPLDVVIPTNSSDKSNIILKSGQRVMVLKSPKGIYMQLESGKIIAIRTSGKNNPSTKQEKEIIDITSEETTSKPLCNTKNNNEFKSLVIPINNSTVKDCFNIKPSSSKCAVDEHKKVMPNENKASGSPNRIDKEFAQNTSQKLVKNTLSTKKIVPYQEININKRKSLVSTVFPTISNSSNPTQQGKNEIPVEKKKNNTKVNVSDRNLNCNIDDVNNSEEHISQVNNQKDLCTNISQPDVANKNVEKSDCLVFPEIIDSQPEQQTVLEPQRYSSSEINQLQPYSHQLSTSQHKKDPHSLHYIGENSHYNNNFLQMPTNHASENAFMTNRDSINNIQYHDTMYENGSATTYEYPYRYPNYSSHNTYTNIQHYHPHFHNLGNAQPTSNVDSHQYYMRWPPIPTVNRSSNHYNTIHPPPYSQSETSANQWHNLR